MKLAKSYFQKKHSKNAIQACSFYEFPQREVTARQFLSCLKSPFWRCFWQSYCKKMTQISHFLAYLYCQNNARSDDNVRSWSLFKKFGTERVLTRSSSNLDMVSTENFYRKKNIHFAIQVFLSQNSSSVSAPSHTEIFSVSLLFSSSSLSQWISLQSDAAVTDGVFSHWDCHVQGRLQSWNTQSLWLRCCCV